MYWEKSETLLSLPRSYKMVFPVSNKLIDKYEENKSICPPKFMIWWYIDK